MRIGKIEVKRRVWLGLAFALVATSIWWVWFRAKLSIDVAAIPAKQPFVRLTGAGTGTGDFDAGVILLDAAAPGCDAADAGDAGVDGCVRDDDSGETH